MPRAPHRHPACDHLRGDGDSLERARQGQVHVDRGLEGGTEVTDRTLASARRSRVDIQVLRRELAHVGADDEPLEMMGGVSGGQPQRHPFAGRERAGG